MKDMKNVEPEDEKKVEENKKEMKDIIDMKKEIPTSTIINNCLNEKDENLKKNSKLEDQLQEIRKNQIYKEAIANVKHLTEQKKIKLDKIAKINWYLGQLIEEKRNKPSLLKQYASKIEKKGKSLYNKLFDSEIAQITNLKEEEQIKEFDLKISKRRKEIILIKKQMRKAQVLIYKTQLQLEKKEAAIEETKKYMNIDFVAYATDPESDYSISILQKILKLKDFFLRVFNCGVKSELFSDDLKEYNQNLTNIFTKNFEYLSSVLKKDSSFLKDTLKRSAKAIYYMLQFAYAIKNKASKCVVKGLPDCAFYKGLVNGCGLKAVFSFLGL